MSKLVLGPVVADGSRGHEALQCVDQQGFRYHLWLEDGYSNSDVVYKNKPLDTKQPRTIFLDKTKGSGKLVAEHLLANADAALAALEEQRQQQEAAAQAARVAFARASKIKDAAPSLLAALEQIERLSRIADGALVDVRAMLGDIARTAIAEATS